MVAGNHWLLQVVLWPLYFTPQVNKQINNVIIFSFWIWFLVLCVLQRLLAAPLSSHSIAALEWWPLPPGFQIITQNHVTEFPNSPACHGAGIPRDFSASGTVTADSQPKSLSMFVCKWCWFCFLGRTQASTDACWELMLSWRSHHSAWKGLAAESRQPWCSCSSLLSGHLPQDPFLSQLY